MGSEAVIGSGALGNLGLRWIAAISTADHSIWPGWYRMSFGMGLAFSGAAWVMCYAPQSFAAKLQGTVAGHKRLTPGMEIA